MFIYEMCTQGLTLAVLFFGTIYCTEWIQVVTLGGLVAGSIAMGAWGVLQDRLGAVLAQRLMVALGMPPTKTPRSSNALPELVHKVFAMLGMLVGLQLLGELLPGYTVVINGYLVAFCFIFALIAVSIGKMLYK